MVDLLSVLAELEAANDALAATRSQATYLSMIDNDGATDALLRLDRARVAAREALAATSPAGDLADGLEAILSENAEAFFRHEQQTLREAAQALRHQSTGVTEEDVGELRQKLKLAEETLEFVHRWTWGKQHSPLGDAERLSAIKHHPCVAALTAQERG